MVPGSLPANLLVYKPSVLISSPLHTFWQVLGNIKLGKEVMAQNPSLRDPEM